MFRLLQKVVIGSNENYLVTEPLVADLKLHQNKPGYY